MGSIVAYARVSTGQQDYQSQVDRLTAAGATKVFSEKRSGLDGGRPELAECMRYVREGDTLIVTKLDRLARSTADLYKIVTELSEKGGLQGPRRWRCRHDDQNRQARDGDLGANCRIRDGNTQRASDGRHRQS